MGSRKKFIDVAANLHDSMYKGIYNGKQVHEADLNKVLLRAASAGIEKIIITAKDTTDTKVALEMSAGTLNGSSLNLTRNKPSLYTMIGCHPTRYNNKFDYGKEITELVEINRRKIVAIGECCLDYNKLNICDKENQKKLFEKLLEIGKQLKLPFYLRCENASDDFISILQKHENLKGVIYSSDGTLNTVSAFLELGFHIVISSRVLEQIPRDKIVIGTDCPVGQLNSSFIGYRHVKSLFFKVPEAKWKPNYIVKNRNEPYSVVQILQIMSSVLKEDFDTLSEQIYENTEQLFFNS